MKTKKQIIKLPAAIALTFFICTGQLAFAGVNRGNVTPGAEGRGGQFQFSTDPAVYESIKMAQTVVITHISGMSQNELNHLFSYKPVDKTRFIAALSNLKFNLACVRVRLNPKGVKESVMLDFGPRNDAPIFEENCDTYPGNEERVEILERFMLLVQLNKFSDSDIQRHLTHETLHLFDYDQEKAWVFSEKLILSLKNKFIELGNHTLIPKSSTLPKTLRERVDFLVQIIGPNKIYKNLCGNQVIMTFNPAVGTYEVRENFYETSETWYLVEIDSTFKELANGEFGGFKMVSKTYVDDYLNTFRDNPELANNIFNVLWWNKSNKPEEKMAMANVDLHLKSSAIVMGFKYPWNNIDYEKVRNPKKISLGGATSFCNEFYSLENLPVSMRQ